MKDYWKQIFSRNKSIKTGGQKLSSQQCAAARAVFGADNPQVMASCGPKQVDVRQLGKMAYKEIEKQLGLDEIMKNMGAAIQSLQAGISEISEFLAEREAEQLEAEREKNFLSSRLTRSLYGDNWVIGASRTSQTSKERKVENEAGWADDLASAVSGGKRPAPQSANIYGRHSLKSGKLPGQYKIS